jgi:hypothetical protein
MHLFIVCCYTGVYHNNVCNVLFNLSSFNNITIYIINQTEQPVEDFKFYNEIVTKKIGVSAARNIGYNLAINEKKEDDTYIYFWDEDIFISKDILNNVLKAKTPNLYDAIIFQIKSFSGNNIGNSLIFNEKFKFLNKYRLGNPSFFFNLNNIHIKFNEHIGPGKFPIIAAEDTLFILQNCFKNFYVIKNIYLLHPESSEINSPEKIYKYSIAQGAICRKMKFIDKILFGFIVLHRPFLGFFFNFNNQKIYRSRIYAFLYGYKKNFNF